MSQEPPDMDFRFDQPSPQEAGASHPGFPARPGLPWENRKTLGFLPALWRTLFVVLTDPRRAFREMRLDDDLWNPISFLLVFACAVAVIQFLFSLAGIPIQWFILQQMRGHSQHTTPNEVMLMQFFGSTLGNLVNLVLTPVAMVVGAFIEAALTQLVLLLWPGPQRGYLTTFKVSCFAAGSTALLSVIPCCGLFIVWVWNIVVRILGMMSAHDIDGWRAGGSVVIPDVVCCCGVTAIIAAIFGFIGAIMASHSAILFF